MSAPDPCLEARGLEELHRLEAQKLRDARRRLAESTRELADGQLLQSRAELEAAKARAQAEYRQAIERAASAGDTQEAAARWLSEITRLNRSAERARHGGFERLAAEVGRLQSDVDRLVREADAARIRFEGARERCSEARRATASAAELEDARAGGRQRLHPPSAGGQPQIANLLRGDPAALRSAAERVAAGTGLPPERAQELLVELCRSIIGSALDAGAISFPGDHPFWSELEAEEARLVVRSLAQVGYRFDGAEGWLDGRVPHMSHVAMALAHAGVDSRGRRPMTHAEMDALWRGAELQAIHHLAHAAPDLSLEQVERVVGARGSGLDELWDNWGVVRRVLLT